MKTVIALSNPQRRTPSGIVRIPCKKFYLLGFIEAKPNMVPKPIEN